MADGDIFAGIWRRAQNLNSLDTLTAAQVSSWASAKRLVVVSAEECNVGKFEKTPGILLTTPNARAFFPKVPCSGDATWLVRRRIADADALLWEKLEWFSPFWVPAGKVRELLASVCDCDKARAIELFNYHTSTQYTLAFQAVCIAQILPPARSLRDIGPLAREAYLAFYSGYRASSISALIPAIEGSLARIAPAAAGSSNVSYKINQAVDQAIAVAATLHFDRMWTPPEYRTVDYLFGQNEIVFAFETFRRWLLKSFFQNTESYDGATWLNRHLFAHGVANTWQQSANFSRLIVALATIGLVESWHDDAHHVSVLFPAMNADGRLLWQQALFQAEAQGILKQIEEAQYHKHGRLVPNMPTDDGVTLRRAILSNECIEDLVRPLRDAGWSVEVSEPDETALFITVVATAGQRQLGVALLYSCATGNEIYRKLDQTCDVILYRGAPYHQRSYAQGVEAHVGPVTGWQPPCRRTR